MFGNRLNQSKTFKCGHFEPRRGFIDPLEAETGDFLASRRCVDAVLEMLELISDMDRFNYVW